MVFECNMLSATAGWSRTTETLYDYISGKRRCVAPDARSAGVAFLRGQTTADRRGLGPRNQEESNPLDRYVLVDLRSSPSHCVKSRNFEDEWTQAHSARLLATRPKTVSVGSDAWTLREVQRLGASLGGARPQQQQLVQAFA